MNKTRLYPMLISEWGCKQVEVPEQLVLPRIRGWGLQLLIRLTLRERMLLRSTLLPKFVIMASVWFRHMIMFCLGLCLSLSFATSHLRTARAFLEFRTPALAAR